MNQVMGLRKIKNELKEDLSWLRKDGARGAKAHNQ